ncbi:hypothetical protein [Nocardiopsis dassonvillei]|uniref:hypothetical protein n=1 Tax=Nocardiopsis dassonvillei TaxID=2014 RepID=UPI0036358B03
MSAPVDPLVQDIRANNLDNVQAAALADVIQVVLDRDAQGTMARPGGLEDPTVADAVRWRQLVAALQHNRPHLYASYASAGART